MVAKCNAVYLGHQDYEKVNADGVNVEKSIYMYLLFDVENSDCLVNPRVSNVIYDRGGVNDKHMSDNVPAVLERCVVDVDVYVNPRDNRALVRIVGVCNE